MSISNESELAGMQKISEVVGITLRKMREYARPGMSTKELDEYGGSLLSHYNARSAPNLAYGFPGWTCISVNNEVAHGIPSEKTILQEGDLVNIDVSAELNGYWSDNGGSFVLGQDIHNHNNLVEASRKILYKAIQHIRGGIKIADIGNLIEKEARMSGYRVIRNLAGHGIGRSLHEEPSDIVCYYDRFNKTRFKKNSVVAIETFISTRASHAYDKGDGWTLVTKDKSFVAQHEHTILVTDGKPIILTEANHIWN
ncbi:type I methionyl aminopeptidase [Cytophagaceae bacterium DM2B3-1]|uniref:Methionine aminopeptidase n=1 Tax=Xanthocytophaga flava TaxID=3048013 RepID=A0ABT7CT36_9BACT|nr:type I methionyl aminopeptidase [Xanthocytophaga flavus]MDJ1471961.1 type I methionyl aminopeptidase [Xanthocytophaga flavus]MDJ1496898.1 type I methionyl aminopeptidase [Xanthocytophaga flavus]